jgi:hypothetical protein
MYLEFKNLDLAHVLFILASELKNGDPIVWLPVPFLTVKSVKSKLVPSCYFRELWNFVIENLFLI